MDYLCRSFIGRLFINKNAYYCFIPLLMQSCRLVSRKPFMMWLPVQHQHFVTQRRLLDAKRYSQSRLGKRLDDIADPADQQTINVAGDTNTPLANQVMFSSDALNNPGHKTMFDNTARGTDAQSQLSEMQVQMIQTQIMYQRELDRLEGENRDLRHANLLLKQGIKVASQKRKAQRSLIDMYSEVLDDMSRSLDKRGDQVQDQLPRVVVVGDQSSGKTSVLEMLVQARIFPRGAGEMMTRAPVTVALSEGPYHNAQFRDCQRPYDLSNEQDLSELRKEIEMRMRMSIRDGSTVSNDAISLTVKGPGLRRMVLVDLPGVISTVTKGMAADTRDRIKRMIQGYMNNQNAIILCIQDGSVDPERSNVTDLVAQCDPNGERTIFVLTKIDMAENLTDPKRIRKMLTGDLFPMKALGYYAVVTGRGSTDDSINAIREYEENFFRTSKLLRSGAIRSTHVTTRNLSLAVSDCFWKMVRTTVEHQAAAVKSRRFVLEAEWKNKYPDLREQDRNELYERARGLILDEFISLSQYTSKHWKQLLVAKLWSAIRDDVFNDIYLPAAGSCISNEHFNTIVDIKLRHWVEQRLPEQSAECGWVVLQEEFAKLLQNQKPYKNLSYTEFVSTTPTDGLDDIFDPIKKTVIKEIGKRYRYEKHTRDVLRLLQLNTLEDRTIPDESEWFNAVNFLKTNVRAELEQVNKQIENLFGEYKNRWWLPWKKLTSYSDNRLAIKARIENILQSRTVRSPNLADHELTEIRAHMQDKYSTADDQLINDIWKLLYRHNLLSACLATAKNCKEAYGMYQSQKYACYTDITLFYRIQQMLKVTSNVLRQQITNREVQRLDRIIKDILDEDAINSAMKEHLLSNHRVALAEELKRVRRSHDTLEEFIEALTLENSTSKIST